MMRASASSFSLKDRFNNTRTFHQLIASETSQVKTQQLEEGVQLDNDALLYIKIGETVDARGLLQVAESIRQ
jgi:hypothetical protein